MGKQVEYLNRVLESIIGETKCDDLRNVISPIMFSINWYVIKNPEFIPAAFKEHCKDVYGLSKEETKTVWYDYKTYINSNKLNENVDKQKNFFDKVLDRLLKDTVITDSKITFPFANFKQPELSSDSLLSVSTWIDGMWENHKYPSRFNKYCMDIYGLTYMESLGLWNSYIEIIEKEVLKRLRQNSSGIRVATTWNLGRHDINESHVDVLPYMDDTEFIKNFTKDLNEKQKGFLDKVVEHILRETEIDYEKWRVNYPFFKDTTYSFQYTLPFSGPFIRYCKNIYPLSMDEMRYIHFIYTGIIDSKIRKYYVDNDIYNKYYNVMGTKDIINFDR